MVSLIEAWAHAAPLAAASGIAFPKLDPIFFSIPTPWGGLPIRWYSLAYLVGALGGAWLLARLVRTPRLWGGKGAPYTVDQVFDLLFWAFLGVLLGGRLGYVLFYKPNLLWEAPGQVLRVWDGGMAFHGGLLGVGAALMYFSRKHGIPLLRLVDGAAAVAPLGLFFGRIANFINGELYGRVSTAPWAVRFPQSHPETGKNWMGPDGEWVLQAQARHPSQLYEAVLEGLLLFAIVQIAIWRFGALKRPGLVGGLFLAGYGAARMFVELFREPDYHMPEALRGYITMGLLLSLPMLIAGVWLVRRAMQTPPLPVYGPSVEAKPSS